LGQELLKTWDKDFSRLGKRTSQDLGQELLKTWDKDFSRLGTIDFSRLGSLFLIGMGQVKFRRKKFQIFRKIKKRCKPSQVRTKPKIFGKFGKKLVLVLCAFWTICHVFRFFEIFRKIEISLRIFKNNRNFKKIKNGCKWRETRRKLRIFEIFEKI
jgi:hypothetical protein